MAFFRASSVESSFALPISSLRILSLFSFVWSFRGLITTVCHRPTTPTTKPPKETTIWKVLTSKVHPVLLLLFYCWDIITVTLIINNAKLCRHARFTCFPATAILAQLILKRLLRFGLLLVANTEQHNHLTNPS